ncbi:MAG TPA: FUSC family protein, partial [Myxococcaceae bacterium]|nr:FUSC family protein [Myxococcaceae bacterium]
APGAAAGRAGLVLAGGLFQGVLVVISWAFRPGGEERKALADTYSVLAGYASSLATGRAEAPTPSAFPASEALEDPNPLIPGDVRAVYLDLLGEAARIRASLSAIATYVLDPSESDRTRRFARDVGNTLTELALGLGAPRREWPRCVDETERRVGALDVPADAHWRWAGEALLGQLRAVTRILAAAAQPGRRIPVAPALSRSSHPVGAALATLHANATLKTEAGRHALRLAVAAGVAELLTDVGGLQYGRWAVLTVLLVLKPDYASTVTRSVQRAIGTLLGAVLALGFIGLVDPGGSGTSLAAVVVVAVAYVTFASNYLVFSMFVTAFVVLLLDLLGLDPLTTAEGRLGATALGAAWGLVAYLVWPTWAGGTAPETFAVLIERLGTYLVTLVEQLAHPGRLDLERLRHEQEAARRARSDAEAAAERLSGEPPQPPLTPELARNLMAVCARLARPLLAAQTLVEQRTGTPMPTTAAGLEALAGGFQTATEQIASALRERASPGPLPPLRQLQIALTEQEHSDPSVVLVTDALVDAVGSLGALLDATKGEAVALARGS